jgi:membrane glycosyltransferase
MSLVAIWARYFALALVVELGIAVPVLGRRQTLGRRAAAVSFAQLIGHPAAGTVLRWWQCRRSAYRGGNATTTTE